MTYNARTLTNRTNPSECIFCLFLLLSCITSVVHFLRWVVVINWLLLLLLLTGACILLICGVLYFMPNMLLLVWIKHANKHTHSLTWKSKEKNSWETSHSRINKIWGINRAIVKHSHGFFLCIGGDGWHLWGRAERYY